MNVKLGIDTGGSYTDAVVICQQTRRILRSAKARTTRENLLTGIERAVDRLELEPGERVTHVCLSTTLATNAIVESRGGQVALLTIGIPDGGEIPADQILPIGGKISVTGCELEPLDKQEIIRALCQVREEMEAVAVSGYASVRNPVHELRVAALAREFLGKPVVCAHELTSHLGYFDRTVTAVLNAKLIPVISDLVRVTKEVLSRKGIDAPLLLMKGTGHVVIDRFARERPVETILSGPAASIVGGLSLANHRNAVIADMGGTTTDIVAVREGRVPLDKKGAVVGGWRTMVKAARINTYGLGGDSFIDITPSLALRFGPRRVEPLCVAAVENPGLLEELRRGLTGNNYLLVRRHRCDCFKLGNARPLAGLETTGEERAILELLQGGAHSILYLGERLGRDIDQLELDRLLEAGCLQQIALTPTDLLHATGEYTEWSREAAQLGVRYYADRLGVEEGAFVKEAVEQFVYQVAVAVLQSLAGLSGVEPAALNSESGRRLLELLLGKEHSRYLELEPRLKMPIIGIGAPARAWFPKVARLLGAELVIPDHSAVANAYGSVACDTQELLEALVRFNRNANKFVAHTPRSRELFGTIKEAKDFSKADMVRVGEELAARLQIDGYEVCITEQDRYSRYKKGVADGFIESRIQMVLSGSVIKDLTEES